MAVFKCKCVYEVEVDAATKREAAEKAEMLVADGRAGGECICVALEVA